jgi:hypothetical protein
MWSISLFLFLSLSLGNFIHGNCVFEIEISEKKHDFNPAALKFRKIITNSPAQQLYNRN